MPNAQVIIRLPGEADREARLAGMMSIGRASDNAIRIDAPGVSRYHAVIEPRDRHYQLSDLGSVNGTTLNGVVVTEARALEDGDVISVGGAATLIYHQKATPHEQATAAPQASPLPPQASATAPATARLPAASKSKSSLPTILGVVGGLAIVGAVAVVLILYVGGSAGPGAVHIISPESDAATGDSVRLRVKAENPQQIVRVVYRLDGIEVARGTTPPDFEATIDPNDFKEQSLTQQLSIIIEERGGARRELGETVALSRSPGSGPDHPPPPPPPPPGSTTGVTTGQYQAMAEELAFQISKRRNYSFDSEFLTQVERYIPEYRDAVIDDARRTEIIRAFSEENLSAVFGLTLAMSVSKFKEQSGAAIVSGDTGVGIMRMPAPVAIQMGYIDAEGVDGLKDVRQNTNVAARYLKTLTNRFGPENFIYAIACYGLPLDDTRSLKDRADQAGANHRVDFWRVIKSVSVQRSASERVARFFAAGIVGLNPRQFSSGLRPLNSF